ncbi:hypothetical protein N7449_011841 [Penicillium cf. viridicatum]|uniref:Uncharacterized protein n=1 Tax=Penicillium cf. viridicatum TaxID=2972119 RepID=A0A9W9IMG6_9EURO|nr:hypothetical protein N7449_011841 [Penicillium cf. viridicatum]
MHPSPEWDHVVITQPRRSQSMITEGYLIGSNSECAINARYQSNQYTRGNSKGPCSKDGKANNSDSNGSDGD